MATIEERAKDLCYEIDQCYTMGFCGDIQYDEDRALSCARLSIAEQDRISRNEEKERCIKAAQKFVRNFIYSNFGNYQTSVAEDLADNIRKAIEEGGEELWK